MGRELDDTNAHPGLPERDEDKRPIPDNPFLIPNNNRIYSNSKKRKIALDMLERYTGSHPSQFRKQIILTNFNYYLERFAKLCGDARTRGSAMGVVHFILPTAAIRDEGSSHHFMPIRVPALPTFKIQKFVSDIIVERGLDYRTGVVHTTDYRFWEFDQKFKAQLYEERALAIEMETATLFVAGFASKVPIGALLLVSDLPLKRNGIKTKRSANSVFKNFTDLHLEIGIKSMSEIAERGEHIRHYRW
jgi:AMP nucleosidase